MVLAIILFFVAILAVISVFRQLKYKNILALAFSALAAVTFGFFSISTIFCELVPASGICKMLLG